VLFVHVLRDSAARVLAAHRRIYFRTSKATAVSRCHCHEGTGAEASVLASGRRGEPGDHRRRRRRRRT